MKKTLIAIFSVSITAGTIYYSYSKFKEFTINKLLKSWVAGLENSLKQLSNEQQTKLRLELDKLYLWEIKLLVALTSKIQSKTPDAEKAIIGKKLTEKKIFQKADLSSVEEFLEIKKYSK